VLMGCAWRVHGPSLGLSAHRLVRIRVRARVRVRARAHRLRGARGGVAQVEPVQPVEVVALPEDLVVGRELTEALEGAPRRLTEGQAADVHL